MESNSFTFKRLVQPQVVHFPSFFNRTGVQILQKKFAKSQSRQAKKDLETTTSDGANPSMLSLISRGSVARVARAACIYLRIHLPYR